MSSDWPIVNLGEIAEVVTKGTTPTSVGHKFIEKGINFIKVECLTTNGEFIKNKFAFISEECNQDLKRSQLKEGDILFSIAGALGRTAIVNKEVLPANTNQALSIIRLKPSAEYSIEFIYKALSTGFTLEQIEKHRGGVAQQNLSLAQVKSFEIPLPPFDIQKRIVAILDEAFAGIDTAIASAEQNLANARELFESYLERLFAQRNDEWSETLLQDVCTEIFAGGDVPKGNFTKEPSKKYRVPIYTNGEKNEGLYGYTETARVTSPSITISARGTIGYTMIRKQPYYPAIRLIVAIPDPAVLDLAYLYYAVKRMTISHSGTSIPQLTTPMVRKFSIAYPSIPKQKEVVEKLDTLSSEIKRLEGIYRQKLESLSELKQSLLQKAFTGELTAEGDKLMDEAVA